MPEQDITSPHNPRVKQAAHLRERRQRDRQARILIDGAAELTRALQAGVELLEVFACRDFCVSPASQAAVAMVKKSPADLLWVTPAIFEKIAFGQRHDGLLGVAVTPLRTLADIRLPPQPLVAVLEGIEKPGNLGAVLRSADATGVSAVIVADGRTDLFNPNAIRASLGAIFTLPVCQATSAETLAWLRQHNLKIFAARVDGATCYTAVDLRGPAAIVLGNEAQGLSSAWRADDIAAIQLPMRGAIDSLNVSATAAVLFYEALRQRAP